MTSVFPTFHNPQKGSRKTTLSNYFNNKQTIKMADDEDIAALVVDNGSGMCKGESICRLPDLVDVHRSKMTT